MERQEIMELLKQIKIFYPRFDAVEKVEGGFRLNPDVIDSWYKRLGYMSRERAFQILNRYMESEDGQKTPHISLWINGGKQDMRTARCTAVFDRQRGIAIWTPDEGLPAEEVPLSWNYRRGAYEDAEGRLWAFPGT